MLNASSLMKLKQLIIIIILLFIPFLGWLLDTGVRLFAET